MASRFTFSTWSTFLTKASQLSGVPAPFPFKPTATPPVSRPPRPYRHSPVFVHREVALGNLIGFHHQAGRLAHGQRQRVHVLARGIELAVHALLELAHRAVRVLRAGHAAERAFLFVVHAGDLALGLLELVLELLHLGGRDGHRVRVVDRHGSSSPSENSVPSGQTSSRRGRFPRLL